MMRSQKLVEGDEMSAKGLPFAERRAVSRLIRSCKAEFVVLIGSWARGCQSSATSDVDLLVGLPSGGRCEGKSRLQVICLSSSEISQRASEGDDLPLWALRYGLPLSGRRRWDALRDEVLPGAAWPNPKRRFALASRQLDYAHELAEMGDHEAAVVELNTALGHLARGVLLEKRIFPLSRPEVPDQLRAAQLDSLASLLDAAATRNLTPPQVKRSVANGRDLIGRRPISA